MTPRDTDIEGFPGGLKAGKSVPDCEVSDAASPDLVLHYVLGAVRPEEIEFGSIA